MLQERYKERYHSKNPRNPVCEANTDGSAMYGRKRVKNVCSDLPVHKFGGHLAEALPEDERLGLRVNAARQLQLVHLLGQSKAF